MKIKVKSSSPEETRQIAKNFLSIVEKPAIILLNGDLGAGKTFFVKSFTAESGSSSQSSSPTFSIINQYESPIGDIYHLDLYRIADFDELYEIGFEDILDQDAFIFIEWPEIAEIEQADYEITIKDLGNNQRQFEISSHHDLSELEVKFNGE